MFQRLRNAITSQPWRTTAIVLGIGLIGAVVALFTVSDSADGGEAAVTTTMVLGTSTTTTTLGSSTTITATPEPSATGVNGVLAIKVDNAPGARPQYGIGDVPLLIEFPVEGGLTRFTAVLDGGETGLIGPIRSLRPTDPNLLSTVSSVVVSSGGRPFVMAPVEAAGLVNVVAGFSSMFVSVGNPDPYDTFVDLAVLEGIIPPDLSEPPGLPTGELPTESGTAVEVDLPFEGTSYRYEEGTGYVRLGNGEPFLVLDREGDNEAPLTHDVLVVLSAAERPAGYTDVNGVEVSTFDVIGGGDLLIFHQGRVVEGSWSRNAQEDGFEFFDDGGTPVGLPEGRVYLAIVPRDSQVSYQ